MALERGSFWKQCHCVVRLDMKFQDFYVSMLEMNVVNHKLMSVTIGGVPVISSENCGLIGLGKKNSTFTDSLTTVIYQQAVCTEVIYF